MKKCLALLAALAMAMLLAMPVYATGEITTTGEIPPDTEEEAIVVYDWETGQPVGGGVSGPVPVDIRMEMVGTTPYITRIYQFETELGLADVPQSFEQDGYTFTRHDVLQHEVPGTVDTKTVTKTEAFPAESEDVAALLETIESEMAYSEGGFTGTLASDVASVRFEAGEKTSYTYTITETREYPGLPANDAGYIDKTITKNGATLELEDIQWEVTATTPTDTGLVPTQYKGIATYSGRASGSKVANYTAFVTYTGEVAKTEPGTYTCAVIFRGEPLPEPVVKEEPAPAPSNAWLYCLIGLCIAGLAAGLVLFIKRGGLDKLRVPAGEDEDDEGEYEVVMPTYASEMPAPELALEPDFTTTPVEQDEPKKAETAAKILASIGGMDEAEKPKNRRGSRRGETVPLVEKLED